MGWGLLAEELVEIDWEVAEGCLKSDGGMQSGGGSGGERSAVTRGQTARGETRRDQTGEPEDTQGGGGEGGMGGKTRGRRRWVRCGAGEGSGDGRRCRAETAGRDFESGDDHLCDTVRATESACMRLDHRARCFSCDGVGSR